MATKEVLHGFQLKNDQSLAASFQTDPVTVKYMDNVGFNISTASVTDNTGSFAVQHRIYKDANNASAWATLTLDTTPTLADGNDTFFVNLNQLPPGQVRIAFTAAGGTPDGTCDIWVSGCSLGG
jgi:hypothetical protein